MAGMQVLVAMSDPTERRVLALQTELWGAPSTAAEPSEIGALVKAGRAYDVVLLEHRKPSVDGLAIAGERAWPICEAQLDLAMSGSVFAAAVVAIGVALYMLRARHAEQWPFAREAA